MRKHLLGTWADSSPFASLYTSHEYEYITIPHLNTEIMRNIWLLLIAPVLLPPSQLPTATLTHNFVFWSKEPCLKQLPFRMLTHAPRPAKCMHTLQVSSLWLFFRSRLWIHSKRNIFLTLEIKTDSSKISDLSFVCYPSNLTVSSTQ